LTINYRGSTTFGREFQEKISGNPGHWEVEDVAAARDWLVREAIADPAQMLLTGGRMAATSRSRRSVENPSIGQAGWLAALSPIGGGAMRKPRRRCE
jgi:hypothetical protein